MARQTAAAHMRRIAERHGALFLASREGVYEYNAQENLAEH
jgi:hypothetical protein